MFAACVRYTFEAPFKASKKKEKRTWAASAKIWHDNGDGGGGGGGEKVDLNAKPLFAKKRGRTFAKIGPEWERNQLRGSSVGETKARFQTL